MNSLYGRFGMDQYLVNSVVIDKDDLEIENVYKKSEVDDIIELDNKLLIQYFPKEYNSHLYQENLELDISIAIASSVTAYSRCIFYNICQYRIFY